MNIVSRTIAGAVMIFSGTILIVLPFFLSENASFFMWIYGMPLFIIGCFILFNKREDQIEQIRSPHSSAGKRRMKEDEIEQIKSGGKKK